MILPIAGQVTLLHSYLGPRLSCLPHAHIRDLGQAMGARRVRLSLEDKNYHLAVPTHSTEGRNYVHVQTV